MARTGIFGGSFNPIHYGHLLMADQVFEILSLDRLLFVPAAEPPHKPACGLAAALHRHAMTRLATADDGRFVVSDIELCRTGPSYTVDTLEALSDTRDDLILVMGSETFLGLLGWHAPQRLPELARLAVVPRSGSAFDPEGPAAQKVLRGIGADPFVRVTEGTLPARGTLLVHALSLPVSASDIRERVRGGRSVAYRLPPEVIAYMDTHRLYRER
ncbi:MAG: nicotinate-nucleotide adenylyltransferase [Candidatus Rokuibacteriota bacterium]